MFEAEDRGLAQGAQAVSELARQMSKPTLRQELETEHVALTERLALVKTALGALSAHPEVASVLETISKIRGLRY